MKQDSVSSPDSVVGSVKRSGDASLTCGELENSGEKQWRWLSFPESRMVANPWDCAKSDTELPLNLGLFVGGIQKRENLVKIRIGTAADTASGYERCETSWFPHQLTARAFYACGARLELTDFFADKDTFIRTGQLSGDENLTIVLSGACGRLEDASVLSGCECGYSLRLQIFLLNADSSVQCTVIPEAADGGWMAQLSLNHNTAGFAVVLTLSVNAAASRPRFSERSNISHLLEQTEAYWNRKLSRIPAPTQWGIRCVDPKGVTARMHKRAFYAAWTFLYQNILEPTPERGYAHYQITLGKASLWPNGSPKAPNSCVWESLFCIEQIALLEPALAWDAAAGFIDDITDEGRLEGESLPSQKAHAVWCCYVNLSDKNRLTAFYPKIKQYLIWRQKNPRWIFGGHDYSDEKDISFVAQWYLDVGYAKKICAALDLPEDLTFWDELLRQMDSNLEKWFFTPAPGDPADRIYNTCFESSGAHYAFDRTTDAENYICSLLAADIPAQLQQRLRMHYRQLHNADADLAGFDFYKYGDGCCTARGLIRMATEQFTDDHYWREFTNAALRHVLKTVEFSEEFHADVYEPFGVIPSSFGASTVIDFTYLNNGVRIDDGSLRPIDSKSRL